jgi:hypothetical protein
MWAILVEPNGRVRLRLCATPASARADFHRKKT